MRLRSAVRQARSSVTTLGAISVLCAYGCSRDDGQWSYWAIQDVGLKLPDIAHNADNGVEPGPGSAQLLLLSSPGKSVVLIAQGLFGDLEVFDSGRSTTFVIVLEAPLRTSTVQVTPDNGRLIYATAWSPMPHPGFGLRGKIRIRKLANGEIVAKCDVRGVFPNADSWNETLQGTRHFRVAAKESLPALPVRWADGPPPSSSPTRSAKDGRSTATNRESQDPIQMP